MGFLDFLKRLFGMGPSKEELAREEQAKREQEQARLQREQMEQRLRALEQENRTKEALLKAEVEKARCEEAQRKEEEKRAFEEKMKRREQQLKIKYAKLLEEREAKVGSSLKEREDAIKRQEEELRRRLQILLSEQDRQIEAVVAEHEAAEEEKEMVALEREMLEAELEKVKEKERELARRAEEIRIQKKKSKFGEQPGLGMTDDERKMLGAVLGTYTFDNFVVGANNRFPREASLTVAKEPANAYNPLFIYSSVGLGKTHLLSSIGNHILENHRNLKVAYLTTERFANELLRAIADNQLEEFRARYRDIDVLLIDDIQFLSRQEQTQTEFFHTFNSLYNNHRQIVIASDRPPAEIATLESRLQSRFEGGLITQIKPPDITTRIHILREKMQDEGWEVDDDVINFLAEKVTSNIRTLLGALNRVAAYSRLTEEPCTVSMASEVLKDMLGDDAEKAE